MKNWKGKKYKHPNGNEYPMASQWQYRQSQGATGLRFIPEAKKHAIKVLRTTKSLTGACLSVGCSFPTFRTWLEAAGVDHTKYKKGPGSRGPKSKAEKKRKGIRSEELRLHRPRQRRERVVVLFR